MKVLMYLNARILMCFSAIVIRLTPHVLYVTLVPVVIFLGRLTEQFTLALPVFILERQFWGHTISPLFRNTTTAQTEQRQ